MAATAKKFGRVPSAVARLATSPELLNGFLKLNAIFESSTLPALDREVLIMTVAARNGCHLCVAMHTASLTGMSAAPELVAALRAESALPSPRLEALRRFVSTVMDTTGDVPSSELAAFTEAGYTTRNALEVVLGIGTYTLSTFANRLTDAPLDEAFAAHEWHATAV
ncbi:carboxymuconolactone decarboxylase family protein [Amycolatopsis sp. NPDC098790]|uniref:carboxymuconolactone decarboxylase family protein n=1 Tax=Amycolatopsis sp. NPDC098790 TaxID=3363939 RepID=UPI00381AA6ED